MGHRRDDTDLNRMPRERQVLVWYSQQWRELRGGPVSLPQAAHPFPSQSCPTFATIDADEQCDMGLPEAQVVLIAMGELAMF
jgi:hypothetical protein